MSRDVLFPARALVLVSAVVLAPAVAALSRGERVKPGIGPSPAPTGYPTANSPAPALKPVVSQATGFAVSPAARTLPPAATVDPKDRNPDPPGKRRNPPVRTIVAPRPEGFQDPLVAGDQRAPNAPNAMPAALTSFEGVANASNQSILGVAFVPPDTNGDVGRTQYRRP